MVSYDRQTIDSPNPLAKFAHRRRVARSILLAEKLLPMNGVIVDFGAGPGLFLRELGNNRPDARLYAIEPFMQPSAYPRIKYIEEFSALESKADVISAFETCEHLSDSELDLFLGNCASALQDDGRLIVSVPIMIGWALPLKILNRSILFGRPPDYSGSELIAGIFGRSVQRPANRAPTHKGFDFRWLRRKILEQFVIENEILSPLPLPWWLNSQVFFICRKATADLTVREVKAPDQAGL